jgi:excisionase family DNA binding protein
MATGSAAPKRCAVAAQPSGKAAPELPHDLRAAEVADIVQLSPKTVSRWAKEGKLPFLKTLGGHRRYPAAEIRQLADELEVVNRGRSTFEQRRELQSGFHRGTARRTDPASKPTGVPGSVRLDPEDLAGCRRAGHGTPGSLRLQ